MTDPQAILRDLTPAHSFFVGIDSDGCAFDTMELKHKECFIPNTIKHYALQAVSRFAREVAEFINLYSRWRGINRFPGLAMTLDVLRERPEVQARGVKIRGTTRLRDFITSSKSLGNPALKEELERTQDPELELALRWSEAVNRDIAAMVHGVKPFPLVRACLETCQSFADLMCVSATPLSALTAEWREHDIAQYVRWIVGQEVASKKDALRAVAAAGHDPARMLMVGDAPGDMEAAKASGALFFPVVPGEEEASWKLLHDQALDRFRQGTYAGAYQASLIENFLARLPGTPPWKR